MKTVQAGCRVKLKLVCQGNVETHTIVLVQNEYADIKNGFISVDTPIARLIIGHSVGETIPYQNGDIKAVYIEKISPIKNVPGIDQSKIRKELVRKAVADSERTNAMIFASSFSGKWGDYDPDSINEEW